ncbi:CRISPR system precrRNA processing endoribonuclease RAMP protein Cas6 [candidate division KSB1 bacterium]|nr:CRISPR system precrRNA processing endoribonuclease RAMP protein Cas6 [candidate division KSB1 bacterium]
MSTESDYVFPVIPYLKLRFQLRSLRAADLPGYKGSLLRGAFGHALRRSVCVMPPKQLCENCMLRSQCAYPQLFETFISKDPPPFMRGLATAPRPYVFEPLDLQKNYNPGDPLQFDLLLFGESIERYPYLIFAVSEMAKTGLGRNRYPFFLETAWWQDNTTEMPSWRQLYDGEKQKLLNAPNPSSLFESALQNDTSSQQLQLSFLTPTRLKFRDELTINFTFRMLCFKMIRRVLELAHFHVPAAIIDWEFHQLLVAADDIEISENRLQWSDWQRHSNRQNTDMKMGGFIGDLMLNGELRAFLPLVRACEVLHIGKGTVFGNGKIGVNDG